MINVTFSLILCCTQTLVERLLAEGVGISVTDKQRRTALLHSVIHKHDTITHLLLAHHSALVRNRLNTRKGGGKFAVRRSAHTGPSTSTRRAARDRRMGGGGGVPDAVSDLQVFTVVHKNEAHERHLVVKGKSSGV